MGISSPLAARRYVRCAHMESMSPKKCDFSSIFVRKILCCQNADIDSVLVFTIQNGSRTFFFKLLFAWIWGPKNHPKTSQKPCPGDPKIDLENVLFFNIDFFAFWPRFWSLLGALGTLAPLGHFLGVCLGCPPLSIVSFSFFVFVFV